MSWLEPDAAEQALLESLFTEAQAEDAEPGLLALVERLAPAPRIESLLLRNTRLRHVPDSDAGLESRLWFGPLVAGRGERDVVLHPGLSRLLAASLHRRLDAAGWQHHREFLAEQTAHWDPVDRLALELRLALIEGRPDALRSGLRRVVSQLRRTSAPGRRRDLARWAKSAVTDAVPGTDAREEAAWLASYAGVALGDPGGAMIRRAGDTDLPGWLRDALPASGQPVKLALRLYPGLLAAVAPDEDGSVIALPGPAPVPIMVVQQDSAGDALAAARWAVLQPGAQIALVPRCRLVELRSATGARWRLRAAGGGTADDGLTAPAPLAVVFSPEDERLAIAVVEVLRADGHDAVAVVDPGREGERPEPTDVLRTTVRLWSEAAFKRLPPPGSEPAPGPTQGLLLRLDNAPLPEGAGNEATIDLRGWEGGADTEAARRLRDAAAGLSAGDAAPGDDDQSGRAPGLDQGLPSELDEVQAKLDRARASIDMNDIESARGVLGEVLAAGSLDQQDAAKALLAVLDAGLDGLDHISDPGALLELVDDPDTEPPKRLAIGDRLAALGDPRRGVGLRSDGVPDIDWVEIAGGEFVYGEDGERRELPGFRIARYPVTNAQFGAFVEARGYEEGRWWEGLARRIEQPERPGWEASNRPRETVSWYEAVAFCRWLSAQLGEEIRLPVELEWERAARGAAGLAYPWGDAYRPGYANVDETETKAGSWYLKQTTAVGMYPQGASPEGVLDLAGNVLEWCLNDYGEPGAPAAKVDLGGTRTRALRGGSWYHSPVRARASHRSQYHPVNRNALRGFRVLCASPLSS